MFQASFTASAQESSQTHAPANREQLTLIRQRRIGEWCFERVQFAQISVDIRRDSPFKKVHSHIFVSLPFGEPQHRSFHRLDLTFLDSIDLVVAAQQIAAAVRREMPKQLDAEQRFHFSNGQT
jgi:hypothetical protein